MDNTKPEITDEEINRKLVETLTKVVGLSATDEADDVIIIEAVAKKPLLSGFRNYEAYKDVKDMPDIAKWFYSVVGKIPLSL